MSDTIAKVNRIDAICINVQRVGTACVVLGILFIKQRSRSDVNFTDKRKYWTNSVVPLYQALLCGPNLFCRN